MTKLSADVLVDRLILQLVRSRDTGWKQGYEPPEHFVTCPDVTVTEVSTELEVWFDTGVEATRIFATLQCPHGDPVEWEWADLGELPDLLDDLDKLES